ncbi:M20/M25/M40 family metallo-hydrolase [Corallococcus sp. AB049A]|uniref:M20/M25/M40 family metallo-hydrolase n=1 Tax=Corallococcus interemptor TaxID=2316720 RepID=A0A3A8QS66_9BACT|nr:MULTISPECIES: M20 family metallopeptidase [Corallococcus]RKH46246.1 M20/M25/M40 family metallo-hydrolase [Corallococcus sp. AB050B]RKH67732.1 M20/M25/M40 family metallo-hydrolase [Corallococcus interemptor]RKI64804.1 M20/M25/M40 family metallo-hydrolase [Corallococcus sp. AB049A]
MNVDQALASSERIWEQEILPALERYIRIPNKSPAFDPDWVKSGHMEQAVQLIADWCRAQAQHLPGLTVEVVRLKTADGKDRTPVIYMEVPGTRGDDTVLLYGHLDKQPEMTGWREDLTPWTPKREGDKLFGRGGADDGYSAFASLSALRLLKEQNVPHARCAIVIEACEESGSYDLPAYIEALAPRIGKPSLVVCLDSGCANYEQLWMTTSLRGMVAGNLRVDILTEGVHSGDATGVVASSMRIMRQLLSRVEDESTGHIKVKELHTEIPEGRRQQAKAAAQTLGEDLHTKFPWVEGARPVTTDGTELVLNRTWRPALALTGVDGVPGLASAGNVLRPFTTWKLSMRIPPRVDPKAAAKALKETLEKDPPYGAKVSFDGDKASVGWDAPPLAGWLSKAVESASKSCFGKPAMAMGEGGTIPFMGMLGERFPEAQFLITGLLGPGSNAHGPNEFLHIPTGKKLTAAVASVVAEHFKR